MMRDSTIDFLRGFMMLYVIFVIHGLCWFHIISDTSILFSLLLFEMPIIFYIAGAAQKLSIPKTLRQYAKSRFLRVMVPYLIWCIGAIFVLLVWGDIKSDWIHLITCSSLKSVPYVWHVWFIYPYLIVSFLGFYLIKAYRKWDTRFVFFYSVIIAVVVALMDYHEVLHVQSKIVRPVLVYSVFYVLGYTYKEEISIHTLLSILAALIITYLSLIFSHTYSYATQLNKFPPNFAFLCYGGIATMVLSLCLRLDKVAKPPYICNLLQFANTYGFELYMYQCFAMQGYAFLAKMFWPEASPWLKYVLILSIVPFLLFPMAYIANKINKKICRVI